jgi:hypothetical protein
VQPTHAGGTGVLVRYEAAPQLLPQVAALLDTFGLSVPGRLRWVNFTPRLPRLPHLFIEAAASLPPQALERMLARLQQQFTILLLERRTIPAPTPRTLKLELYWGALEGIPIPLLTTALSDAVTCLLPVDPDPTAEPIECTIEMRALRPHPQVNSMVERIVFSARLTTNDAAVLAHALYLLPLGEGDQGVRRTYRYLNEEGRWSQEDDAVD